LIELLVTVDGLAVQWARYMRLYGHPLLRPVLYYIIYTTHDAGRTTSIAAAAVFLQNNA
jgi:hypothetical protein